MVDAVALQVTNHIHQCEHCILKTTDAIADAVQPFHELVMMSFNGMPSSITSGAGDVRGSGRGGGKRAALPPSSTHENIHAHHC